MPNFAVRAIHFTFPKSSLYRSKKKSAITGVISVYRSHLFSGTAAGTVLFLGVYRRGGNAKMARLNVEEDLYKDARFFQLALKLGSREAALGALIFAWSVAQKYWKNDKALITEKTWKTQHLKNEIIDCGLAKVTDAGIYVCGSEKQFAWLMQKVEAGRNGGKKSGAQRRSKTDGLARSGAKRSKAASSGANPPSPSPSPSQVPFQSHTQEEFNTGEGAKAPSLPKTESSSTKVWEAYRKAFVDRYHEEPVRNVKVNGQIGQLVARLGEEAIDVVKFYVSHQSSFYVRCMHSIGPCLKDAEALRLQWKKGRAITQSDIRQFENNEHYRSQIDRIKRGEL